MRVFGTEKPIRAVKSALGHAVQGLQLGLHLLVAGEHALLALELRIVGPAVEWTVSLTEMQAFVEHDVIQELLRYFRVVEDRRYNDNTEHLRAVAELGTVAARGPGEDRVVDVASV